MSRFIIFHEHRHFYTEDDEWRAAEEPITKATRRAIAVDAITDFFEIEDGEHRGTVICHRSGARDLETPVTFGFDMVKDLLDQANTLIALPS